MVSLLFVPANAAAHEGKETGGRRLCLVKLSNRKPAGRAPTIRCDTLVSTPLASESIVRRLGALVILIAAAASRASAFAADSFPSSGSAKLAAYAVCRSAVIVDMGPVGSNSSAECTGTVKTLDGSKILDNLAIRCIKEANARREGYAFSGTCIHTDGDGDKIFMTYEGPESGTME